jgi:hypothetical protein
VCAGVWYSSRIIGSNSTAQRGGKLSGNSWRYRGTIGGRHVSSCEIFNTVSPGRPLECLWGRCLRSNLTWVPPQDARKHHARPRSGCGVDHSIVRTASHPYPLLTLRSDNAVYGNFRIITGVLHPKDSQPAKKRRGERQQPWGEALGLFIEGASRMLRPYLTARGGHGRQARL